MVNLCDVPEKNFPHVPLPRFTHTTEPAGEVSRVWLVNVAAVLKVLVKEGPLGLGDPKQNGNLLHGRSWDGYFEQLPCVYGDFPRLRVPL